MLSNKQIAQFLGSTNLLTKPYFRGVYTISELGEAERACDLNTLNVLLLSTPTHWLGCFIYPAKPELCAFIDSLGKQPSYYSKELEHFLGYMMPSYVKLPFAIQSIQTDDSGLFTCFMLHHCCVQRSINYVCTRYFRQNMYRENSAIMYEWYKEMFSAPSIQSLFGDK